MNGEQNSGKEPAKHISMELTADGARVTNLSLEGSRLILTIEAELAGSQLKATDSMRAKAAKPSPATEVRPGETPPRSDTEFVIRPQTPLPSSPAGTLPGAAEAEEDVLADHPGGGSESLPPAAPQPAASESGHPAADTVYAPPVIPPIDPAPAAPEQTPEPAPAPVVLEPNMAAATYDDSTDTETIRLSAPMAPPLEPVRELTDTWDAYNTELEAVPGDVSPIDTWLVATPTGQASATSESGREFRPDVQPTPHHLQPAAPVPEATRPISDTWHKPLVRQEPEDRDADTLAISEESNVVGGDRHGEPQPAISFGLDAAAPRTGPAPVAIPETPAAMPEPAPAPAFGPAPVPPPFAENPAPVIQPEMSRLTGDTEAPTLPSLQPYNPGAAAPKPPQQQPQPAPDAKAGESGGTTVLIRYTCPKCKTQGMQAVDKVGTVVHCSNCGKAMRLVMKK